MENETPYPRSRNILLLLFLCAVSLSPAHAGSTSADVLLQPNNLTYVGAVRLPRLVDSQKNDFDFGGAGLAFYPAHNSLFINNHVYSNRTVEIGIPAVLGSTQTLSEITVAPVLQGYADVTEGHLGDILAGGAPSDHPVFGGAMVYNNRFIGSSYDFYDALNKDRLSHFTHSLTIDQTGTFQGMYLVGDSMRTGFVSGYMTQIPGEWQAALGGPALTGNCCLNIVGRTSLHPSVSVFNPDDLGSVDPVPVTEVLSEDLQHSLPSDLNASQIGGVVFPAGTRTLLFFGRRGAETGGYCYGEGTANQSLHGKPVPDEPDVIYCYDPADSAKGGHDYPYVSAVWAYNVDDLVAVKNGTKHPWEVLPYARWDLSSISLGKGTIMSTAYDPATQRIYVSQYAGEQAYPKEINQYNARPLIHVFQVNNATPIPTPFPTANLMASPNSISAGSGVTLSWTSSHGDSMTIDQTIGTVGANGSITVTPAVTTTYTLSVKNLAGSALSRATVTVTPAGTPPPTSPPPLPPPTPTPLPPTDPGDLTLNVGPIVYINAQISATYKGSASAPSFAWSFTPTTTRGSVSMLAGAPSTSLKTTTPQANLAMVPLTLGPYVISVQALDGTTVLAQTQANVTMVPTDLSAVQVYPNPWRSDKDGSKPSILFNNLTANTTIKIFTVSGHWIKTLPVSSTSVPWDLTNDSGNKVASGIYVYLLTTDQGQKKTGQIVVIK